MNRFTEVMTANQAFSERLQVAIRKMLLEEYTCMKLSTINEIADQGAITVKYGLSLCSETANIVGGVRRVNFFDLPRELRDRIYLHAQGNWTRPGYPDQP